MISESVHEDNYDVFISYSRRNKDFAQKLVTALESQKKNIWFDNDDLPKAKDWKDEITRGIQRSHVFLFIISPDSVGSDYCRDEIEQAVAFKKRFLPVLHMDISDTAYRNMHFAIGTHNWIYSNTPELWEKSVQEVIRTIELDIDHTRTHTNLAVRASEWENKQRDTSYLLSGSVLNAAEIWLQNATTKDPEPTNLHTDYIVRSRSNVTKRNRIILSLSLFALIIVSISLVLATWFYGLSEEQRAIIFQASQRLRVIALINSAYQENTTNQIKAIALAVEAAELSDEALAAEVQRIASPILYAAGPINRYFLHNGAITAFELSADGRQIASADITGKLLVWELDESNLVQEIFEYHSNNSPIDSLAFSPDGDLILIASCPNYVNQECTGSELIALNISTGDERFRIQAHSRQIRSIQYNASGTQILTAASDGEVKLWDAGSGQAIGIALAHDAMVWEADYLANNEIVVSISQDGVLSLWNITSQQVLSQSPDSSNALRALSLSHRFPITLSGGRDGQVYLSNISEPSNPIEVGEFRAHTDLISDIDIHDRSGLVLSASWDGSLMLWQTDGTALYPIQALTGHDDKVQFVRFSLDGETAFSASDDGTIIQWDLSPRDKISQFRAHNDWVWDIGFSTDNQFFSSSSTDQTVLLWNSESLEIEQEFRGIHTDAIRQTVFHPDGSQIISASEDGTAVLWDIATASPVHTFDGHNGGVMSLDISRDGRYLATASKDMSIIIWDLHDYSQVQTLTGHTNTVRAIRFLSDGKRIVSASYDTNLILWDWESATILQEYQGHSGRIVSFDISPSENQILSGAEDRSVILWDLATGQQLSRFEEHNDTVTSVAFSPDGNRAASSGWDGIIYLLDLKTGAILHEYRGHAGNISSIRFRNQGREIISVSSDNQAESSSNRFGHFVIWRADDLPNLLVWASENRFVRGLSCSEEALFGISLSFDGTRDGQNSNTNSGTESCSEQNLSLVNNVND